MNQRNVFQIVLSTIAGALAAFAVCAFFFFYYKAPPQGEIVKPLAKSEPTPPAKEVEPRSTPPRDEEIDERDVSAVSIETTYKNFFAEGSDCRREFTQAGSPNSPCTVKILFNRDGSAEKTIEVRGYDQTSKSWKIGEKKAWKAKVTNAQFEDLTRAIVESEAFKEWNDRIMINTSNCKITVRHKNGTKSPMSNVGETAIRFLPMVGAFKQLDAEVDWQRTE